MKFNADLHLHSHFSRATAKNLNLESLYTAACLKGITVLGTGDFTHPGWFAELKEKLVPGEEGLFCLRPDITAALDKALPGSCRGRDVRFILQVEISSIYKKEGRVRKNHNLVYFPDMEMVQAFNERLDTMGNISSDGRPILGLDARDLLEIVLETGDGGYLIPAHIWTPWFSMLGSKSGFDTIEECFGDLAGHIFAAETGLSSDPPMNWRVANLDRVTLISNSDAHSPMNLGRNASVFDTELTYGGIRSALEKGDPASCVGTLDLYPQEGKYHYDGHRKCNVCITPAQTLEYDGICPVCGRPMTLGVLYRVQELAERPHGYQPENRPGFRYLIPLAEILSEIHGVGPKTKKVAASYDKALERLGPELSILLDIKEDKIREAGVPLLPEAVARMRRGDVKISPGYDGEYGRITLFDPREKKELLGEMEMFPGLQSRKSGKPGIKAAPKVYEKKIPKTSAGKKAADHDPVQWLAALNPEQQEVLNSEGVPLLIEAGPGTGKTRTLTAKMAHLILEKKVDPGSILALTFTNKAAGEMAERMAPFCAREGGAVCAATFHAFCLMILREYDGFDAAIIGDQDRRLLLKEACRRTGKRGGGEKISLDVLERTISAAKQKGLGPHDITGSLFDLGLFNTDPNAPGDSSKTDLIQKDKAAAWIQSAWQEYQSLLSGLNLADFEDLIAGVLELFKTSPRVLDRVRSRYHHVFVDEYQDINQGQYLLTKELAGESRTLLVIGDPDQSIYGFRGSDNRYFHSFFRDYPQARRIVLKQNYRSTQTILDASFQIITKGGQDSEKVRIYSDITGRSRIILQESPTAGAEAVWVGKRIESLVGGISLFSMDAGKADGHGEYSFSDMAVLYRTRAQAAVFAEIFEKAGIPFQTADRKNDLDRAGIRELLSLARVTMNSGSLSDFFNSLALLGFRTGEKTLERISRWFYDQGLPMGESLGYLAEKPLSGIRPGPASALGKSAARILALKKEIKPLAPAAALELLARDSGLISRIEETDGRRRAYARLIGEAERTGEGLSGLLQRLALRGEPGSLIPGVEKVSLMTMHASKGLEFPVVFVSGCEEGLVPLARPGEVCMNPDEERRLFYVAMTRARDILCLTWTKKRRIYGRENRALPSSFLRDIEENLKKSGKTGIKVKPAPRKEMQLDLFG